MKRVLVTGASGFLGYHVIHALLKQDVEVTATSIEPESMVKSNDWFNRVKYISYDLNSSNAKLEAIFDIPDILIHLAWQGLPNYNEEYHLSQNQKASSEFIKKMIDIGVQSVAVSGTCFEYGMKEGCLSEEMNTVPSNNYGLAKDNLRKELEQIKGINLTWARFFYIHGYRQNINSLLGQLQNAIIDGDNIFNMSPGDQLRDFIEVDKAAELFVRLALNNHNNGIVNICSGTPVSVKDFIIGQLDKQGVKMHLNTGYYPYSQYEPKNFWGSTLKLYSLLK